MRLLFCSITLGFIAFVNSPTLNAQAISDEMRDDVATFLGMTGVLKMGEQMGNVISQQIIAGMNRQNPNVPPAATEIVVEVVREHIDSFVSSGDAINGLVEIYAKHYTHEDIEALIAFYRTPLGAKMIQVSPMIAAESAQFGQTLFVQQVPLIQKDIQQRFQAAGLQPPPQPQPQQQPQ